VVALNSGLLFMSALFLSIIGTPSYAPPEPAGSFAGCPAPVVAGCQVCLVTLAEAQDTVATRALMTIISMSLSAVATFLPVFGGERVVYFREASALVVTRCRSRATR
jgi:hypothetical protein